MEYFNPSAVEEGTAGVMNALFVGEAYANWGLIGVAAAPFVVAFPFSLALGLLLRLRKSPASMTLYLALFIFFTGSIQGGFVDYIYNVSALISVFFFFFFALLVNHGFIVFKNRQVPISPGIQGVQNDKQA